MALSKPSRKTVLMVLDADIVLSCHRNELLEAKLARSGIGVHSGIHFNGVAILEFAVEQLERQRVLNEPLYRPPHGPRAVVRIVALLDEQVAGGVGQLQAQAAVAQQLADTPQLYIDDRSEMLAGKRVEHDDIVDTI